MREALVQPAWEVASENSTIKIFNFFPSFLATLYLAGILAYQIAWGYVSFFNLKDSLFWWITQLVHADYFTEILIGFGVFFCIYVLIIPIAEGGLIALIDKIDTKAASSIGGNRNQSVGYGIARWLKHFLPVFEANSITSPFKLISIITFTFFLIRLIGSEYTGGIVLSMFTYFLIAMTINIFLAYTRFFIVLQDMKAFDAIIASSRMALEHFGITVRLYITLLIVYLRTLLTVLAFILFPFVLSAILTYITITNLQILFVGVLGVLVIGFFVFVSHLSSVLEIFVETLWYRAYIENLGQHSIKEHRDHHESHATQGHTTVSVGQHH